MVTTASLRINQLSDQAWDSYREYLEVLDRYDVDAFAGLLAEQVTVRFNNDDPLVGKDVVVKGLAGFWASIQEMGYSLEHEPLNVYGSDQHHVLEALNHYDTADGRRVTIRAVAFTDRDEQGRVTSIRVYQDLSPLYAAG